MGHPVCFINWSINNFGHAAYFIILFTYNFICIVSVWEGQKWNGHAFSETGLSFIAAELGVSFVFFKQS